MTVSPLFFLQAPYPALQTLTVLPSPKFSDSLALTDAVAVRRAMDGTRYTYVKTKGGRKKLKWEFLLTRNKGLELRAFIQSYFASQILITDHLGRTWIGYFMSNPFEFDTPERGYPPRQGWPVGEVQAISIEFEGVQSGSQAEPRPRRQYRHRHRRHQPLRLLLALLAIDNTREARSYRFRTRRRM